MPGEIETALKIMTRPEQKVARAALASPYRVLCKSIGLLAGEAGVSEPGVIRFCRALNYKRFQDLLICWPWALHLTVDPIFKWR